MKQASMMERVANALAQLITRELQYIPEESMCRILDLTGRLKLDHEIKAAEFVDGEFVLTVQEPDKPAYQLHMRPTQWRKV